MNFYTNVAVVNDTILYRGFDGGERVERREEFKPTLYVPSKNERFGATAGQIKREILEDAGKHPIILNTMKDVDESGRLYSSNFVPAIDKNKIVFGNMSRYAKNWMNGPNHEIRNLTQLISLNTICFFINSIVNFFLEDLLLFSIFLMIFFTSLF